MSPERLLKYFEQISEAPEAVPRLRRFILDLAVRGKLVEQYPADEPAVELLKRIEKEKKQLVKYGSIKESKRLSPVKDSEISSEAPMGWKWTRLGESVNNHFGGGTPSKGNSNFWDGNIYWASVKDIGKTKYVDHTIDRITEAGLANSSSNLIQPGNLIVVTRMGLGKVSINRIPIAINQDLRALSLSSLAAIDFYYIFFKTASYEGTGLTVKGIKVEELLNFPFPLPPLAEQHRIVAKVDELMALCDELEASQAKRERQRDRLVAATLAGLTTEHAEVKSSQPFSAYSAVPFFLNHLPRLTTRPEHIQQLRQTILDLAVRGKLVQQNSEDELAAEALKRIRHAKKQLSRGRKTVDDTTQLIQNEQTVVPFGWQAVRFQEILLTLQTGPFGSSLHQHDYEKGGTPVINPASIQNERIVTIEKMAVGQKTLERLATFKLRKNDVVMGRRGEMGRCAVVTEKEEGWLCGTGSLILRFTEDVSPWFIVKLMSAPNIRKYLGGASVGATMQNLNQSILCDMPVGLPPLAEQHRILTKIDELMALCDEFEAHLHTTATARQQLLEATLHEALTLALPSKACKVEVVSSKVVDLPSSTSSRRRPNRHFARAVLSAEIVHQLHAEPTFGRTKHQKILHLCEHIAQIEEISGEYFREAAGPLDNRMIYSVEAELKKQRWFEEYSRARFGHAYRPLEKAGAHRKYFERYWPNKLSLIQQLLDVMRTWDTDRCEIFSTAYAAWNDLLLWDQDPTDEAILKEVLEHWHERKKRFAEERWRKAIAWMRKEGFIPEGFGKPTQLLSK